MNDPIANLLVFSAAEKGKCCFNLTTITADYADTTKAHVTNCPARFSNASGVALDPIAQVNGTTMNWWCSETASSMELALINCR